MSIGPERQTPTNRSGFQVKPRSCYGNPSLFAITLPPKPPIGVTALPPLDLSVTMEYSEPGGLSP